MNVALDFTPPTLGYADFLASKAVSAQPSGIPQPSPLHEAMYPHQRMAAEFALKQGRAALFLDTGLMKTGAYLEWARVVSETERRPVLIQTPLAVAPQVVREGLRFGIEVHRCRDQSDVCPGVNVTNYDRLGLFDPLAFAGVVLDESAILRDWTGATKRALCKAFETTPFRLCATATPAPNDHMELGNHSEFLGIMPAPEMLSRWFITAGNEAGKYRLKGHAVASFWDWVASWAVCMSKPSDLGFPDDGFILPPLNLRRHVIAVDQTIDAGDYLFRMPALSATDMHREKRLTIERRAGLISDLVRAEPDEPWILWCDTNYEADALAKAIPEAVEVRGSMSIEVKEDRLDGFSTGRIRVLISKPRIAGHGLNWQHCARQAFVGLSFSFDALYQAVRRCWRFGQTRPVTAHIAMAETEIGIWQSVSRKMGQHESMAAEMLAAAKRAMRRDHVLKLSYNPKHAGRLPKWIA